LVKRIEGILGINGTWCFALVTDKRRNKDFLENLQVRKCRLLKKFPLYITTLMLMDCNIRREWMGVPWVDPTHCRESVGAIFRKCLAIYILPGYFDKFQFFRILTAEVRTYLQTSSTGGI
jgi:hypothetical protein